MHYFLKCRKNTESKNAKVVNTKIGRTIVLSTCVVYDSKKSKFIKEQETSGFLISLEITIPLSKIPFVGPLLF